MRHGGVLMAGTWARFGRDGPAMQTVAWRGFFARRPYDDRPTHRIGAGTSWSTAMSTTLHETPLRSAIRHDLQAIRGKWAWLVGLGIALIVLGTIMLGSPVIATLATVAALGVLILIG